MNELVIRQYGRRRAENYLLVLDGAQVQSVHWGPDIWEVLALGI